MSEYKEPRFEMVGYCRVRNMSKNTDKVCMVFRDHEYKCIRLVEGGTEEDINLLHVPSYDEKKNASLWERINAWKNRNSKVERRERRHASVGRRFRRQAPRWQTTAKAPTNLPPLPVRQRSVGEKGKVMTKAEVKDLMREALGDLLE